MKLYPAYLWIGCEKKILVHTNDFIKKIFCNNRCDSCYDCKAVNENRHHRIIMLEPENYYTIAKLEIIFNTIIYALGELEQFFFVIKRADLLTQACANSLLKSLEEPPTGYHFILLSPSKENILPTVFSRCIIQNFDLSNIDNFPLSKYFINFDNLNELEFQKDLTKLKLSERDILSFVDYLYNYWSNTLKTAINNKNAMLISQSNQVVDILDNLRSMPPMPGSSKLFLKNLFLQFMNISI